MNSLYPSPPRLLSTSILPMSSPAICSASFCALCSNPLIGVPTCLSIDDTISLSLLLYRETASATAHVIHIKANFL
jgi:hypothetical protein